jgi:predicted metal-dependent phosphoesterase TrpH
MDCPMIDLHVHTTMSDGTFSPEEVALKAAANGIIAIAITDHDTVAGIASAVAEGARAGIEVVSGVEVSTQRDRGILHLLGYFIDPEHPDLLVTLEHLRNGRQERIPRIISKLWDCGVRVSEEEVYELAEGGVPGRPHVANALLRKEYVNSLQDAFDLYLKRGAPAYVDKAKLPARQALMAITKAGGLPVLAHPYSLREDDPARLEETVTELMANGLKGIEAYYPLHTPQQTELYLTLASRLNLAVTGGTDFHGSNKPGIELGVLPGGRRLPYTILENLKAKHSCHVSSKF